MLYIDKIILFLFKKKKINYSTNVFFFFYILKIKAPTVEVIRLQWFTLISWKKFGTLEIFIHHKTRNKKEKKTGVFDDCLKSVG